MKSTCGSELPQGRGVPSAPGRCMSPALALRSMVEVDLKSKTFSCVRTPLGRAVAGASPGGRCDVGEWVDDRHPSSYWTEFHQGPHTIPDIARPLIGGHGAPGSKRYGSVTQARQTRDTPVTAGKRRTLHTDQCTFGSVHKGLKDHHRRPTYGRRPR